MIVVEGKNDRHKIKRAVKAHTIETNGSAISEETLQMIKHASEKQGVIVFTDPDYAGMRIRQIIDRAVPNCKHAFLTKEEATNKRKQNTNIGIEHASIETIQQALKEVYEKSDTKEKTIQQKDLIFYKLVGHPLAKRRRQLLGDYLRIGYTNGKQLLNRLNMFNITKQELKEALNHIIKDERRTNRERNLHSDSE